MWFIFEQDYGSRTFNNFSELREQNLKEAFHLTGIVEAELCIVQDCGSGT